MRFVRRIVVFSLVTAFVVGCSGGGSSFHVLSVSMCPTVGRDDHVKFASPKDLHRGDVVIARNPNKLTGGNTPVTTEDVITRIVAVPGDVVTTEGGRLVLNGEPADEPWLAGGVTTPDYFPQAYGPLGADRYVGMGDNRVNQVTYEFGKQQVVGTAGDLRSHSTRCDETPPDATSTTVMGCDHKPASGETVTRGCADLIIFMEASATQSQIDAVAAALRADSNVVTVTYLDSADAKSEFSSLEPGIAVPPDLPTSFHVVLKAGVDRDAERSRYMTMPGVYQVLLPTH